MTHAQRSRPAEANHEAAESLTGDYFKSTTVDAFGAASSERRRAADLHRTAEGHCASSIDAEALADAWDREVAS